MPAYLIAHLLLMTAMVVLLVSAVVLARLRRPGWFGRHRLSSAAGLILGAAGAATMAVHKAISGHPHLATAHSWIALPALILALAGFALGYSSTKGYPRLRPVHKLFGVVSILGSILAIALAVRWISWFH